MSSLALGREDLRDTRALAHKLFTQCRDASSVFKSLNTSLRKFRNILEEIEDAFDDGETIGPEKMQVIERVIKGRYILLKLDLALQHYRGSRTNQQNPSASALADLFTSIEVCTRDVSNAFYAMGRTEQTETRTDPSARSAAHSPRVPSLSVTSSERGHIPSVASSNWSSGDRSNPTPNSTVTDGASANPSMDLGRSQNDETQLHPSRPSLSHTPVSSSSGLSPEWKSPFAFMDPLSVPLETASSFILADDDGISHEEARASISSARSASSPSLDNLSEAKPTVLGLNIDLSQATNGDPSASDAPVSPTTRLETDRRSSVELPKKGDNRGSQIDYGTDKISKSESIKTASSSTNPSDHSEAESNDLDQTVVLIRSSDTQLTQGEPGVNTASASSEPVPVKKDTSQLDNDAEQTSLPITDPHAMSIDSAHPDIVTDDKNQKHVKNDFRADELRSVLAIGGSNLSISHDENSVRDQECETMQHNQAQTDAKRSSFSSPSLSISPPLREAPRGFGSIDSTSDVGDVPITTDLHHRRPSFLSAEAPPVPPRPPKRSPPPPPPPRKPTKNKSDVEIPKVITNVSDAAAAPSAARYTIANPSPQSPLSTPSSDELYSSSRPPSPAQPLSATLKPEPLRIRSNSGVSITFDHVADDFSEKSNTLPKLATGSNSPVSPGLRRSIDIPRSPRRKISVLGQKPEPSLKAAENVQPNIRHSAIAAKNLDRADSSRAPEASSFMDRVKTGDELNNTMRVNEQDREIRGFYDPTSAADVPGSPSSSFDLEQARRDVICESWNRGAYSEAHRALSEYATHLIATNGNNDTLRRVRHLLGVSASLRGAYKEAIPFFLAAFKSPIEDTGKLDAGDFAAAYWLGDCYALTNQRKEALLAYSIVERSPLYQEPRQPRLPSLIKAEQSFCEFGVSKTDYAQHWANEPPHDAKAPITSILDTRVITAAAARLCLETAPRRTLDLQSACDTTKSRAFTLQSLHIPGTPLPLRGYRDHRVVPAMFQSGVVWPMLYDPFFAIANVARGRLLAYECDLEKVYGSDAQAQARVPKSGPVFLSRIDCFTSSDLLWLIRAIRECLKTFDMAWSEVANTLGTWFVVRYSFMDKSVATTHYFAISIFKQSMRSGYGVEICPDGVCSARDTRRDNGMIGDYVKGVHYSEPKRIKKIIREYLDHAAKDAKGKRKTTYMPPDDGPKAVMPTDPLELHTDPIPPPELGGDAVQPPELCDSGEILPALPPRPKR